MADNRILVSTIKMDGGRKSPPKFKSMIFDMKNKKLEPFVDDASNAVVSPDGKNIVYVKRSPDNRSDLYIYNIKSGKHSALADDTLNVSAPSWSSDGKYIAYNTFIHSQRTGIEIVVMNVKTRETKQITSSGNFSSYSPVWSPKNNLIVYYLEKGDNHDQIYLTDSNGSFHKNLTNDMTTHNFYPSWMGDDIIYTLAPRKIATIKTDGTKGPILEGIESFSAKYNPQLKKIIYLDDANNLMLYDVEKKTSEVLLESKDVDRIFL